MATNLARELDAASNPLQFLNDSGLFPYRFWVTTTKAATDAIDRCQAAPVEKFAASPCVREYKGIAGAFGDDVPLALIVKSRDAFAYVLSPVERFVPGRYFPVGTQWFAVELLAEFARRLVPTS